MLRFSKYPWYTILFAMYSPLALLAYNAGQVAYSVMLRSLVIVILAVLLLTSLAVVLSRNPDKAGIAITLGILLFFSYGHLYDLIKNARVGDVILGRHRYLAILYALVWFGATAWIARTKRSLAQWSSALMTIAVVSLLFPGYQLIRYALQAEPSRPETDPRVAPVDASQRQNLPDVYYIILDTYGRTDVLQQYIGYDNSPFLESLENMGFYIASCSQSNYSQTGLSLASSLNFNYLDALGLDFSAEDSRREDVEAPYIKHSAAVAYMKQLGYKIVAFETGYDFTTLEDADILYPAPQSGINNFELILLRSTALVILDDAKLLEAMYPTAAQNRRDTILFQLQTLKELPSVPGPKFVFAHLLIPHWPYVFGAHGESLVGTNLDQSEQGLTSKEYFDGYRGQVIFTSNQIQDVVAEILQNSKTPPIIIIQGDHGPNHAGEAARMAILNAYYFPSGRTEALYPTITPVNSFPVVFNTFFDAGFALRPDVSYFSRYQSPDQATIIPNECVAQ